MHHKCDQKHKRELKIVIAVHQHFAPDVDRVLDEAVGDPKVLFDVLVDFDRAVQIEIGKILPVRMGTTWKRFVYCLEDKLRMWVTPFSRSTLVSMAASRVPRKMFLEIFFRILCKLS